METIDGRWRVGVCLGEGDLRLQVEVLVLLEEVVGDWESRNFSREREANELGS